MRLPDSLGLRTLAALLAWTAMVASGGTAAVVAQESDWPCVQRLVPRLQGGQMWAGPPLETVSERPPDPETPRLAEELADLDLAPEAASAKVATFAASVPEGDREAALTLLFATVLDRLNAERGGMVEGIRRYARRQQQLAEQIAAETRDLEALRRDSAADATRVAEVQAARDWDLRVHTDRQRALGVVCDQPVRLEQRAFALARMIQEHLP
jgi:hypothetical protein